MRPFSLVLMTCVLVSSFCTPLSAQKAAEKAESAKKKPDDKNAEKQPKEDTEEPADPLAVPEDGSLEDLSEALIRIAKYRPRTLADMKKLVEAMGKASNAVLEHKDVDDKLYLTAAKAKLTSLQLAARYVRRSAKKEALEYATKLSEHKNVKVAKLGQQEVINARSSAISKLKEKEQLQLLEDTKAFYTKHGVDRSNASMLMQMARAFERGAKTEVAVQACKEFAALAKTSKLEKVVEYAGRLEGAGRRIGLMGKEMKIVGTTIDGDKFKWSDYRGKVVLVDFWATWCPPCVASIPHHKKLYDQYNERGFEIVAISQDDNKFALLKFLGEDESPWVNLFDEDHPNAEYYGVMAYPTVMLVDKQGKVVSLNARGRVLDQKLAELLGPPEVEKEKKGAEKDKPKATPKKAEK